MIRKVLILPDSRFPRTRRFSFLSTLGMSFLVLLVSSFASAGNSYREDEVLLILSPEVKNPSGWFNAQGLAIHKMSKNREFLPGPTGSLYRVALTGKESVPEAISRLQKNPGVLWAQPNFIYHLRETIPNDPFLDRQWHLFDPTSSAHIRALAAWDIVTGSAEVIVAVIDTGIDYNHPDLKDNLWVNSAEGPFEDFLDNDGNGYIDDWRGWDFADDDNDPLDDYFHGTHVAGLIGAVGNNGLGVSGVCWNVRIMALDGFDYIDSLSSDLIEAIDYAGRMGARMINASWGDQYNDPAMLDAIRKFTAGGGLFVTAAGNEYGEDNDRFTSFPANFDVDALLSVGASKIDETISGFSSIGRNRVHLFAPGSLIYSTVLNGAYGDKPGTSMASPITAGVAALLWSWKPDLTNLEVKYRILGGVDIHEVYRQKCLSGGRLNAANVFGEDSTVPDAIDDLELTGQGFDRFEFQFTATGDDGKARGKARFYDMRYSSSPLTEETWENAERAYYLPSPATPGTVQSYTLEKLDEAATYFIGMKVIDEVGNFSSLSNEVVAETLAPRALFFSDDLESGTGEWVIGEGSDWVLSDIKSHSGQYCWTESPEGNYNKGDDDLVMPPVNLKEAGKPVLRFWNRYDIYRTTTTYPDGGEIQVSVDGVNWSEALVRYWDSVDWWQLETIDLSAYKGYSEVWIRFHFHAGANRDYDGWYIDDVRVLDVATPVEFPGWNFY